MIGYKGDVLVQVLRKKVETYEDSRLKEERFEDEFIKISDLNKNGIDFVKSVISTVNSLKRVNVK